jgi:hypothetical protein
MGTGLAVLDAEVTVMSRAESRIVDVRSVSARHKGLFSWLYEPSLAVRYSSACQTNMPGPEIRRRGSLEGGRIEGRQVTREAHYPRVVKCGAG